MKNFTTLPMALTLISVPVFAFAGLTVGDNLGTTEADIKNSLQTKGYEVVEIEAEDGFIEAEVVLDGVEHELYIDITTGTITEVEPEDEDDDDEDDEKDKV